MWVYLFRRKTITEFIIKINETSCFENQQFQMKKQDLEPMIQEAVTSMQYRLKEQDILVNLNLKKQFVR